MTNQAIPLVSKYYGLDEFNGLDVNYYSQDSKAPHNPLPSDKSIELIKSYAKENLYNDDSDEKSDDNKSHGDDNGKVRRLFKKLF